MNEQPQKAKPVRTFVKKHKVAITFFATSICWSVVVHKALKQHDDFLKERGLYDEFYTPEESY